MSALRASWCLAWLVVPFAACPADDDRRGGEVDSGPGDADASDTAATTDASDSAATADTIETSEPDTAVDTAGDVDPVGCETFDFTGSLAPKNAPGAFQLGGKIDLGLGGPLPDAVVFEFNSEETGAFELGTGVNANYKFCEQCVLFIQDINGNGEVAAKTFFPKAGTLTIDPSTPPYSQTLKVSISALEMVEVTIRASDFQSDPVEGGSCYERITPLALETGACTPACGGHVCGPDGCGGECGAGCGADERCQIDGSKCEVTSTCMRLALAGTLDNTASGVFQLDVSDFGLGAIDYDDLVQLEFYTDDVGTFDLHGNANRNYATCNQCFRLVVDGRTELFQRGGQLVVSAASSPMGDPETDGYLDVAMTGIVLEEVLIDEEFNSMPLPNGACVEIVDGILSSPVP